MDTYGTFHDRFELIYAPHISRLETLKDCKSAAVAHTAVTDAIN
jgi:hypothetical protein